MNSKIIQKVFVLFVAVLSSVTAVAKTEDKAVTATGRIEIMNANGKMTAVIPAVPVMDGKYIVTEYEPLRSAAKAVFVSAKGERTPVSRVAGASDIYDVIKLLPKHTVTPFFKVAAKDPIAGERVYLLSVSGKQETRITSVKSSEKFIYLSLSLVYDPKYVGLPLVNDRGELVGLLQRNGGKENKAFAVSALSCSRMEVNGMSWGAAAFSNLRIPAALPDDEKEAWNYVYMMSQTRQDDSKTITAIDDYIARYPASADGYFLKAKYFSSRKDYAQSDNWMQKAISSATKDTAGLYYNYSRLIYDAALHDGENASKAGWTLAKALDEVNTAYSLSASPLYLLWQGNCLYGLKRYSEAIDKYAAVNHSKIADSETFYLEARAREKTDTTDTCIITALDSAIGRFTKPYSVKAAPFLMERGDWLCKFKRFREATLDYIEYEHLVGFNNLNENFYYMRYQTALKGNMYQTAEDDINRALAIRPDDYVYNSEKAALNLRLGMTDEAIVLAEKATRIDPKRSDAYRLLGIAWGEKKNKAKCMQYLNKALSLGDNYAEELIKSYKAK